jgi:anti-sigma B factor antagonist
MPGERAQLAIQVVVSHQLHTIILAGELDIATAPELPTVVSAISDNEQRTIVIDLRQLTFIDSSGLQGLLNAHQDCRARGHELRVIPGPENVQRVFELTGVNEMLSFTDAATLNAEENPPS